MREEGRREREREEGGNGLFAEKELGDGLLSAFAFKHEILRLNIKSSRRAHSAGVAGRASMVAAIMLQLHKLFFHRLPSDPASQTVPRLHHP